MPKTSEESSKSSGFGEYFGRLLLEPLPDGRRMRLAEVFGFIDVNKKRWPVPQNAIVDGASIPKVLWSVLGGPFEGKYRDASVVHDYYCSVRIEAWQAVHRVFYDAMIASGVSQSRAKLMYSAVYFAGPRWSTMDTENTKIPRVDENGRSFSVLQSRFDKDVLKIVSANEQPMADLLQSEFSSVQENSEVQLHLKKMQKLIEDYDPTLGEIEGALDQITQFLHLQTTCDTRNHTLVEPPTE